MSSSKADNWVFNIADVPSYDDSLIDEIHKFRYDIADNIKDDVVLLGKEIQDIYKKIKSIVEKVGKNNFIKNGEQEIIDSLYVRLQVHCKRFRDLKGDTND